MGASYAAQQTARYRRADNEKGPFVPDIDQTPLDPEPDPTEDTPDAEGEETAEADDQPGSDPEARLAEAQKLITQQAQELSLFRAKPKDQPAASSSASEASSDDFLARATQDSWTLAETIHGAEAIEAYRVAFDLYDKAQTPADYVTAFEAYHQIRSGKAPGASKAADAPAAGTKTRAEATQPRVDANRSDPGSDPNADEKLSEARKSGSLDQFARAAASAMGFGPSTR